MIDKDLDLEEFVDVTADVRRTGLGGADIGAILGRNPFSSPTDVWLSKVKGKRKRKVTEAMEMGVELEPVVRKVFAKRVGPELHVIGPALRFRDPVDKWMIGQPDSLIYERERADVAVILGVLDLEARSGGAAIPGLLDASTGAQLTFGAKPDAIHEIKTHGMFGHLRYGDEDTDEIPEWILFQSAWYVDLAKVPLAYVSVLSNTHTLRRFKVWRDDKLISILKDRGGDWWHRYVVTGKEPPPDGSKFRHDWNRERFARDGGIELVASDELEATVRLLASVKVDIKDLEERAELLSQTVKESMGEGAVLRTASGIDLCTFTTNGRGAPDYKAAFYKLAEDKGLTNEEIDKRIDEARRDPDRPLRLSPKLKPKRESAKA